jgi:hypothetical protein
MNNAGVEMEKAVDSMTAAELRDFSTSEQHTIATDKACEAFPEVPRDLLLNNLHYKMNGVEKKATHRRACLTALPDSGPEDFYSDEGAVVHTTTVAQVHTASTSDPPLQPPATTTAKQYSTSATQTEHQQGTYCIAGCLAGGEQGNMAMVRCNMCMKWCHQSCCDKDDEFKYEAAWCCPKCRTMPDDINAIKQQLALVVEALKDLRHSGTVTSNPSVVIDSDTHIHEVSNTEVISESSDSSDSNEYDSWPPPNQEAAKRKKKLTKTKSKKVSASHRSEASDSEEVEATASTHTVEQADSNHAGEPQDATHPGEQSNSTQADKQAPSKSVPVQQDASKANPDGFTTVKRSKGPKPQPVGLHFVTVVADSIPKHVNKDYILRKTSTNVNITPEAMTIQDATTYIQYNADSLRSRPLIIHTGTNNVAREHPSITQQRLERLEANLTLNNLTDVAFSSIVYRNATPWVCEKINYANELINMMCSKNGWTYIDNDFIDYTCVSHDNVHLNGRGSELLTYTLCQAIDKLVKKESNH